MIGRLLFGGPGDALTDCWTVGDLRSGVRASVAAAERMSKVASPPTPRVADLTVAADYMRWVDSEHGLEDSGIISADYEHALSA